jgi:hypothetical protein
VAGSRDLRARRRIAWARAGPDWAWEAAWRMRARCGSQSETQAKDEPSTRACKTQASRAQRRDARQLPAGCRPAGQSPAAGPAAPLLVARCDSCSGGQEPQPNSSGFQGPAPAGLVFALFSCAPLQRDVGRKSARATTGFVPRLSLLCSTTSFRPFGHALACTLQSIIVYLLPFCEDRHLSSIYSNSGLSLTLRLSFPTSLTLSRLGLSRRP